METGTTQAIRWYFRFSKLDVWQGLSPIFGIMKRSFLLAGLMILTLSGLRLVADESPAAAAEREAAEERRSGSTRAWKIWRSPCRNIRSAWQR